MPEYRYPATSVIAMSRGERARLKLYSKRELAAAEVQELKYFVKDSVLEEDKITTGVKSVVGGFVSDGIRTIAEVVVTVEESLLHKFTVALDLCVGRGELTKEQRESVTVLALSRETSSPEKEENHDRIEPAGVVGDKGSDGEQGEAGVGELPEKWDAEAERELAADKVEKKKVVKKKATKKKPAKKKAAKKAEEKPSDENVNDELDSLASDINSAFGIDDDDE